MDGLMEALARRMLEDEDSSPRVPSDTRLEADCQTLREVATRYARPCPFKPGDMITPAAWSDQKGKGLPHVVLAVRDSADHDFTSSDPRERFSNAFGARQDLRVACSRGKSAAAFWVESWQFDRYEGPGAAAH